MKLHPNGREIQNLAMRAERDSEGNIWIMSDDIEGFAQVVRTGCKTDNNLSRKLKHPESRSYFPARIWKHPVKTDYYIIYSMEPFGDGGVKQSVRKENPNNVTAVRSVFRNLKSEFVEQQVKDTATRVVMAWMDACHVTNAKLQEAGIPIDRGFIILDELVEDFLGRLRKAG